MNEESICPRVFISYSHDSEEHKDWVLQLAVDLSDAGIHVIFDQWDVRLGQDLAAFMHNGITTATRVLMICTARYIERVQLCQGGAAYERLLVNAEIAKEIDTSKFVPLVRNNPGPKIPAFMGMRLYLDFSDDTRYERDLANLIADLHGVPRHARPSVGSNPFSRGADRPFDAPRIPAESADVEKLAVLPDQLYEIKQEAAGREFRAVWRAAGTHLHSMDANSFKWLRTELTPPLAEHLSFVYGNQLFFIFIEADGVESPGSKDLFLRSASEAMAIPAILKMSRDAAGKFKPLFDGWGLRRVGTNERLVPESMVDGTPIDMSAWELHDFGVQVVADRLAADGVKVLSKQSSPHVDPSIWFEDAHGMSCVVVRTARYPAEDAPQPTNSSAIASACASLTNRPMFASVVPMSSEPEMIMTSRLPRGRGMYVRYKGLELLS